MSPQTHPFVRSPHRTFVRLFAPLLVSLIAEPLTGLADTAFVARLGAAELAGLGVGASVLTSLFWIFNFLGIGTQTEVARSEGAGDHTRAGLMNAQALALSASIGVTVLLGGLFAIDPAVRLMGASGGIVAPAQEYMAVRLYGAPAVLMTVAAFGTLRGLQDMSSPMWIATGVNLLNVLLDPMLIFGLGPIPAMGVAGAAAASVISQWLGAGAAIAVAVRRLGLPPTLRLREMGALVRVGWELFLRTASLNLFLLLATRSATQAGANAGAAHQAIRQAWTFSALSLDAFAIAGQTLVGYFLGAGNIAGCRRVASVVCQWSLGAGIALAAGMLAGSDWIALLLLPPEAHAVFFSAWLIGAASQPVNALTFGTDGIHWGAGDFRYLRNVVVTATGFGIVGLLWVDESAASALMRIWVVTAGWIAVRAAFGVLRIWPGIGKAPLAVRA